ncbi:hypothetical protein [Rhodanobacter lindaniclasticus]
MKAMTPDKARREYPDAWGNIQQQIADVRRDSDADVIALSVSIIDVAGVPTRFRSRHEGRRPGSD